MKNWKFIKIGNDATGPNWDKKRQLEDELRGWMTTASKATGEEKQNAEKQIADIRKELNDVKIKIAHGENKKAGNESIDKQTWSMFKGLDKDAQKEVGNANWKQTGSNEWETELPNGAKIVVYYEKGVMADWHYQIDHKKSNTYIGCWARDKQEAMTESVERAKRLGNSKTGNEKISYPENKLESASWTTWKYIISNPDKYDEKTVEKARNLLKIKTGNARPKEQLLADVRELTKYIQEHNGQGCEKEKRLLGEAKEELDKNYGIIVGNFKTGKSKLSIGDKVSLYGVKGTVKSISGENGDNIYGEPVIEFESEDGKTKQIPEHYLVKVGNTGHWDSKKMIYSKWDDEKGRPSDEYARITWLGEGKGGLAVVWRGTSMTGVKYGSNNLEDLRRWAEEKIGNETLAEYAKSKPRVINGLCRARNAMTKNAMSIADLEAQIKKNEEYIKSLQGKTVDSEGWSAKASIREAQDEIDRMKSRIADLKEQGNKKVGNLDTVEEGDYVTVRFQGELVDGVVRKVQGTQALVTIDNTDVWFPIRSLKESI